MPSHLESFSDQERWNVAFFVFTFRQSFSPAPPESPLPISLKDLATHSSEDLVSQFSDPGRDVRIAHIDFYRQNPPGASLEELLLLAEQKLEKGKDSYHSGNLEQALRFTLDAYLEGVEPVEPALRQRARPSSKWAAAWSRSPMVVERSPSTRSVATNGSTVPR